MGNDRNLSPKLAAAFGVFAGAAGLIGVAVTVWTAPGTMRTVSLGLLGVALVASAGVGIPEILRYRRGKTVLPSHRELMRAAVLYTVEQATSADVAWIAQLEAAVYSTTDAIPEGVLREWYSANSTGFSIVKTADGTPIGHLDLLPMKPKTLEAFLKGDIIEREIRGDSLYSAQERQLIKHLYVESIVVRPPKPLSNAFAVVSVLSNFAAIIERIADLGNVEKVYAIAATNPGEEIMRDLGFELECDGDRRRDGHKLFGGTPAVVARKVLAMCGDRVVKPDTLKALAAGGVKEGSGGAGR